MNRFKSGFTLAEMMVVMLIVSIVLAAMAPVMTTKNKVDNSSPWRYSPGNPSNAYFGAGDSMRALVGQVESADGDNGKLIVNNLASNDSHILFKSNNDILGDLYFSGTSVVLGDRRNRATGIGRENINIGHDNWPEAEITGSSNITIGDASMQSLSSGSHNIGIGTTLSRVSTASDNVAVGDNSLINTTGKENIAMGSSALGAANGESNGNIAIGNNANNISNTMTATIAIGRSASTIGLGSIAIGSNLTSSENGGSALNAANASQPRSIAIGSGAEAKGSGTGGAIAIGQQSNANATGAVAIGQSAEGATTYGVAIGYAPRVNGDYGIAIGSQAETAKAAVALGPNATASKENAIAIGDADATWTEAIAIGSSAIASDGQTVALGYDAKSTASFAVAIGAYSEANGYYGVAIGEGAKANGFKNIAIGESACSNVAGSNKICIGTNSGPAAGDGWAKASDSVERVFIGSKSKYNGEAAVLEVHNTDKSASFDNYAKMPNNATSVVINGNLIVKGRVVTQPEVYKKDYVYAWCALTITTGNANDYAYYRYCGSDSEALLSAISSDRRLKYVGKENTSGLDKIRQLKIFNYTYKKDPAKEPHVGVIAQDLQKVFPNAVKKGADGFLTIRMEDMFFAVINAIKELDTRVTNLEKENKELKARLDKLETKIK